MPRCYKALLLFLLAALCLSCSQEQLLTIEGYYSKAKQAEEQTKIKQALRYYQKLLKHYPRSKYTKEVQLKIADIEYAREDYIDALADYKIYQKYYESVNEAEYVQYRIASCYFYGRLPYDRDQTMLRKAIEEYKNLLYLYPSTDYMDEAIANLRVLRQEQGRAEMEIALQYVKIKSYKAAIGRYKWVLENFPGLGFEAEAYFRLQSIYEKIAKPEEAEKYRNKLLEEFPESRFAKKQV